MKPRTSPSRPAVHFIGIGGISMSALAQWFLAQNWLVSGSDVASSVVTKDLARKGIRVEIGHRKTNIPHRAYLVIRTQAIPKENPEFKEANRRKIPVITNPEIAGSLTEGYRTVAVAGAHGKSTTTAFAALTLLRAKFDPTIIVGTRLRELHNNNFRNGKSNWLVLEADEYARSFLHYTPLVSIVTNIDAEHLDVYRNLAGVKNGFLKFMTRTRPGGVLILNRDDRNLFSLRKAVQRIAKDKNLMISWYSLRDPAAKKIRRVIKIPGNHNLSNALAIMKLARVLTIAESVVLKTIGAYTGSWRRMEYRGIYCGARVYDDYGHHPTEIKATLQGFREKFPQKKILCVFEPHQAERLKRLWKEFQTAFGGADTTLIVPVYKVPGRDVEHPKYNSRKLVTAIQKKHPNRKVFYLENPKNLPSALRTLIATPLTKDCMGPLAHKKINSDWVIVMMGAGDIASYTTALL